MTTFESDIIPGDEYEEIHTGIKGIATACFFYLHGCERVNLEVINHDGELQEYAFDSPRLRHVETAKRVETTKTGGFQKTPPKRGLQ